MIPKERVVSHLHRSQATTYDCDLVGEDKEQGESSDYELNQEKTNACYSYVFNENCSKIIQEKTRKGIINVSIIQLIEEHGA